MLLYTSNYARQGENPLAMAISCSMPDWYEGSRCGGLAPNWELVRGSKEGEISNQEYAHRYLDLIEDRGWTPHRIVNEFESGTVFLCYEKPGDFCHRRVMALWVRESLGLTIPEWENKRERKKTEHRNFVDKMVGF